MNQLQSAAETLELVAERTAWLAWMVYFAKSRTGLFLVVMSLLFTIATATVFLAGLILYLGYVLFWASLAFNLQYRKWIVQIDGPHVSIKGVRPLSLSKIRFELVDLQGLIVHDGCMEIILANQARAVLCLVACSDSDIRRCRDFLAANARRGAAIE